MGSNVGYACSVYRQVCREESEATAVSRCKQVMCEVILQGACLATVLAVFGTVCIFG